jgi:predicted transporter
MLNKFLFFVLSSILIPSLIFAQEKKPAEMADVMRSNGKIYVVVAIVLTILIGLLFYVVRIDKKIQQLEK